MYLKAGHARNMMILRIVDVRHFPLLQLNHDILVKSQDMILNNVMSQYVCEITGNHVPELVISHNGFILCEIT